MPIECIKCSVCGNELTPAEKEAELSVYLDTIFEVSPNYFCNACLAEKVRKRIRRDLNGLSHD